MGKLAILGKLWGYVVQFFVKFYGAKMAEADRKFESVERRYGALLSELDLQRKLKEQANEVNDRLSRQVVELTRSNNEKQKQIQKLEDDLVQQQNEIRRLSDHDAVRADILNVSANGGHK